MENTTPQPHERTALYYPYLVPRDNLWLKQALLFWDKLGSIIPEQAKSVPGLFTDDLEYLESVGIFIPKDPTDFSYLINPDYIIEDMKQIITNPRFPIIKQQYFKAIGIQEQNSGSYVTAMYGDKFTPDIIRELRELGINIFESKSADEYMMGIVEAGIYMSIFAKHFAGASSGYMARPDKQTIVPVTDSPAIRDLLYYISSSSDHSRITGINLILKNLFPSPGEDVPLTDILDFKIKRQDQLLRFRKVMDKYYRQLSQIKYPEELVMASNDIADEINDSVKELANAMKDARQSVIFSSAELLLEVGAATFSQHSPLLLAIEGGRALITAHNCYLNVSKLKNALNSPFTYLLATRDEY